MTGNEREHEGCRICTHGILTPYVLKIDFKTWGRNYEKRGSYEDVK